MAAQKFSKDGHVVTAHSAKVANQLKAQGYSEVQAKPAAPAPKPAENKPKES